MSTSEEREETEGSLCSLYVQIHLQSLINLHTVHTFWLFYESQINDNFN